MILKSELKRSILKQQLDIERDLGILRDMEITIIPNFATIISGIRRCGKSTLARQFLKHKNPIYYTNFEDINLAEFELQDFLKLEEIFKEEMGLYGVFFFDEIQNIQGWEKYIRQLVDAGEQIIITGSNASMLSKELGTRLTGRHITKELYPFSYNEFLNLKNDKHSIFLFEEFLQKGGFPEFLKTNDNDILRNLFQDIYYRDIVQRNDIRNETAIKILLHYLLSNIGKETSYNKLRELIKVGSGNTISQFIDHFEQAYFLFSIKRFDYSIKKQLVNPKKIYCIDNGIIGTNSFSFSENKGRLLENSVFIEIKRKGHEIYYHKEKQECDFVIKEGADIIQVIQVCYELNNDNKQREIAGLTEAMTRFNLDKGLILTFDQEDELIIENKKAIIMPVWKWLLVDTK